MILELKESNSPFWLLGLSNGKVTAGSSTNVPCYYKAGKKQYELASKIIKESGIDEVYLITGIVWDNMKGSWSMKEAGSYIQNKGKLILSKNEITSYEEKYAESLKEDKYPKGVSRDPLPKNGVKTYTSVATALEDKGERNMKLELNNKCIINEDSTSNLLTKDELQKLRNEIVIGSIYLSDYDNSFGIENKYVMDLFDSYVEDTWEKILEYRNDYFADKSELSDEELFKSEIENIDSMYDYYTSIENNQVVKASLTENVDNIPEILQDRFFNAMADGKPTEFKKFTKEELLQFAEFVKELPEQEVTELERSLLLYAISIAHGDDLTVDDSSIDTLKESKIVTPVGNPQMASSFVNIDVDLDHMEVSDFIVRLAQAIRSEQTSVLEYVALRSANGITNEERANIDAIIEEEKNHMVAFTTMLYKQLLTNHKQNVDGANEEFTLPTFGTEIFDNSEDGKLTESIATTVEKLAVKEAGVRMSDEYFIGNREEGRMYKGLTNALNIIKDMISTSGEEVVVHNATLSDSMNEDAKVINASSTMSQDQYEIEVDVDYDIDFTSKVIDNLKRAIKASNDITGKDKYGICTDKEFKLGKSLEFELITLNGFEGEVTKELIKDLCEKWFELASTPEVFIKLA